MSFRKKIKNNTPKVELQSIMTLVAGGIKQVRHGSGKK